jgi:hypothetical protein
LSNWIDGSSQSNWVRHQTSNGVPAGVSDQGVETFIMASMALNASAVHAILGGPTQLKLSEQGNWRVLGTASTA